MPSRKAEAIPEYKVGVRWEPNQSAVFALTYGDEFDGDNGAGGPDTGLEDETPAGFVRIAGVVPVKSTPLGGEEGLAVRSRPAPPSTVQGRSGLAWPDQGAQGPAGHRLRQRVPA